MTTEQGDQLWPMLGHLLRSHPWHGVYIGAEAPAKITSYIEIVPTDTVKYELDKDSGILRIDRPSAIPVTAPPCTD